MGGGGRREALSREEKRWERKRRIRRRGELICFHVEDDNGWVGGREIRDARRLRMLRREREREREREGASSWRVEGEERMRGKKKEEEEDNKYVCVQVNYRCVP